MSSKKSKFSYRRSVWIITLVSLPIWVLLAWLGDIMVGPIVYLTLIILWGFFYALFFVPKFYFQKGMIFEGLIFFLINTVGSIFLFAFIFTEKGIVSKEGEQVASFGQCLYFSIVTWTTLGYGDYHPSGASQPYAALEALLGYVCMGLLVGIIFSLSYRTLSRTRQYQTDNKAMDSDKQ